MKCVLKILFLFFITSCNSHVSEQPELKTFNIRDGINNLGTLKLNQEIESVTFVSLEVTDNDASLIDEVYDFAVTENYIYIVPFKEQRISLFKRDGSFVKTLIHQGQGPNEFTGVPGIQVDEENDRLYVFSNNTSVFTLEGEYLKRLPLDFMAIFKRKVGKDHFALVSFPYIPFQSGSYGLGIFTGLGDTIKLKNDFYSPLVSHEKAGFTVGITTPIYSEKYQSVLFKTGSNDTVFRMSADKISPACILNLQNTEKEIIRSLDATDFAGLAMQQPSGEDIYVADMFETSNTYYFRLIYNDEYYIASGDKKTGETTVEKCEQPTNLKELSDINLQRGMIGTKSYNNFPIWGRMEGDYLVQIVTYEELASFKDISSITIPESLLDVNEEDNPIFIFYKIRR